MCFPGSTVLVTSSVKEAMTIIETVKIDFIFTDHHLPDSSGIQSCLRRA
jgi:response regulator of citrate/malate metabolism